jgi:hypothetical protein
MLTCHPRLVVPPECGFIAELAKDHGYLRGQPAEIESFIAALVRVPKFEHWRITAEQLRSELGRETVSDFAGVVARTYECYGRVRQGKSSFCWGDKNNFYLKRIALLKRTFPEARFLHLVRDGRDVALSYRDLKTVKGPWAPRLTDSIVGAAREWADNVTHIRRSFDEIGWHRVCEIRYEDLVVAPEKELSRACAFLGETYSAEMLDFDRQNREKELEPREFDAWKGRNRESLTADRASRWQREMFAEDIKAFELRAGRLLETYGYETSGLGKMALLCGILGLERPSWHGLKRGLGSLRRALVRRS